MNTPQKPIPKFQGFWRSCKEHIKLLRWATLSNSTPLVLITVKIKMQLQPKDGAGDTAIILTPHRFPCPIHPRVWVIKIAFSRLHCWQTWPDLGRQQGSSTRMMQRFQASVLQSPNQWKIRGMKRQPSLLVVKWHCLLKWEQILILPNAEKGLRLLQWPLSVGGKVTGQDNKTGEQEGSH